MTFKQTMVKAGFVLRKHSPALFTTVGIVGLGVTAVLAYKSRDKVEVVVEEIERKRDLGTPVNKMEVAKGLTEALYQPVLTGVASVACILLAQKIQSNRIKMLVGTLAVEQARNVYFEKRYRKQHGDEEYTKFIAPVDEVENTIIGENGEEEVTVQTIKKDLDRTIGQWYDESEEYLSDDHAYNVAWIDGVNDKMSLLLFQRGRLLLNEVREALGFERIKNGALLGWSSADNFEIEKHVVNVEVENEDGEKEMKEQIWVTWSKPRYIYDEMELTGRYAIYQ